MNKDGVVTEMIVVDMDLVEMIDIGVVDDVQGNLIGDVAAVVDVAVVVADVVGVVADVVVLYQGLFLACFFPVLPVGWAPYSVTQLPVLPSRYSLTRQTRVRSVRCEPSCKYVYSRT